MRERADSGGVEPDFGPSRLAKYASLRRRFTTLYDRIVRMSEPTGEHADACWEWKGAVCARYPRMNIITPDGEHKQIRAHRAVCVLLEVGEDTELFWDLYLLYSLAEFEGDHLCANPVCVNPDHVQLLPKDEHDAVTAARGQGKYSRGFSGYRE